MPREANRGSRDDSFRPARFSPTHTLLRADREAITRDLDIALAGVPFDLGSYYRAGARHGPAQLREFSWIVRHVNALTGVAPFELCRIGDVGDAPIYPTDFGASIDGIQGFFREILSSGAAPLSIGGDHTVTLPILREVARKRGPVGLVHFDAHPDTYDIMDGTRVNVGTPFRRAIEEGLVDPNRYVMIGIRAVASPDPIHWARAQGVRVLSIDDVFAEGPTNIARTAREVVGDGLTYITFDVDCLDSVYVPGTASPEPGGVSMRDAQVILRAFRGLDVVGADVVELSPPLDPAGTTAIVAANLMFELLCLMSEGRSTRS